LTSLNPYAIINTERNEREEYKMTNYTIYLGSTPIAIAYGTEYAYAAYAKTRELAELLGRDCYCVRNGTGEIIASYDPEEE
jgi:hypothetical protein